jgi:hypothetical protein
MPTSSFIAELHLVVLPVGSPALLMSKAHQQRVLKKFIRSAVISLRVFIALHSLKYQKSGRRTLSVKRHFHQERYATERDLSGAVRLKSYQP